MSRTKTYDFSTASDYTYNSTHVDISGGTASLKNHPLYTNLTHYYRFKGNGNDLSASENHATPINTLNYYSSGGPVNYYWKNLSQNYKGRMSCPGASFFNTGTDWSWSYWAKNGLSDGVFNCFDNNSGMWAQTTFGSTNLYVALQSSPGNRYYCTISGVTYSEWHHIVITWNAFLEELKTYRNSVENTSINISGTPTHPIIPPSSTYSIGQTASKDRTEHGYAEWMCWDGKCLTQDQINTLYNYGNSGIFKYYTDNSVTASTFYMPNYPFLTERTTQTPFSAFSATSSGDVKFNLINENGETQYWDDSAWSVADDSDKNTASEINTNISTFTGTNVGIKSWLISTGEEEASISNIDLTYTEIELDESPKIITSAAATNNIEWS